jgi:hypothetical protein
VFGLRVIVKPDGGIQLIQGSYDISLPPDEARKQVESIARVLFPNSRSPPYRKPKPPRVPANLQPDQPIAMNVAAQLIWERYGERVSPRQLWEWHYAGRLSIVQMPNRLWGTTAAAIARAIQGTPP